MLYHDDDWPQPLIRQLMTVEQAQSGVGLDPMSGIRILVWRNSPEHLEYLPRSR